MSMFETTAAPAAPAIPPYSTAEMRSYPLGTLVVRAGLMPLETVNQALAEAADSGRLLGEVLLDYGLPERELTRLLAAQQGQEFVDLDTYPIEYEVAFLLSRTTAEQYCALPLRRDGGCVVVAVPDADNSLHLIRLREALQGPIRLVTAARSDIKDAIESLHEPIGTVTELALADVRGEAAPAPGPAYRIEVTLESGATLLVSETSDFEEAKAIGMRIIDEAEAGGTVAVGDATIDGRQVQSVDVLGRSAA
jgi:hypothetical protein